MRYKLSTLDGVYRLEEGKEKEFIARNKNDVRWQEYSTWLTEGNKPEPAEEDKVHLNNWDKFRDYIMSDWGYNRIRISQLNTPAELLGSRLEAASSRISTEINIPTVQVLWNAIMDVAKANGNPPTEEEIEKWNYYVKDTNMPIKFGESGDMEML